MVTFQKNLTRLSSTTTEASTPAMKTSSDSISRSMTIDNGTQDLMADSTNQTLAQDLPVAERLRALNRYVDRKGDYKGYWNRANFIGKFKSLCMFVTT